MAFYEKVGVTEIRDGKMLVTKEPLGEVGGDFTYETVGGKRNKREKDKACIVREAEEELLCILLFDGSPELLGTYNAPARKHPRRRVTMRLYKGRIEGEPNPQIDEGIVGYDRIGSEALETPQVQRSPLMKEVLIDLIERGIVR